MVIAITIVHSLNPMYKMQWNFVLPITPVRIAISFKNMMSIQCVKSLCCSIGSVGIFTTSSLKGLYLILVLFNFSARVLRRETFSARFTSSNVTGQFYNNMSQKMCIILFFVVANNMVKSSC